MPIYKRGFKIPAPWEKHSILWELGGILFIVAIVKFFIEYFLGK